MHNESLGFPGEIFRVRPGEARQFNCFRPEFPTVTFCIATSWHSSLRVIFLIVPFDWSSAHGRCQQALVPISAQTFVGFTLSEVLKSDCHSRSGHSQRPMRPSLRRAQSTIAPLADMGSRIMHEPFHEVTRRSFAYHSVAIMKNMHHIFRYVHI